MKPFAAALALSLAFLVLILVGCGTTGGTPQPVGDDYWPPLGWDTNAPSLDPVTNRISAPVYKELP